MLFDRPRCPDCDSRLVFAVGGTTTSPKEYEFTSVYGDSDDSPVSVDDEADAVDYYDFYQCLRCSHSFNASSES
ncbi:hypothetical protein [Natrononativus amylolyticus]|uniref:hypothetical protein n=1 Tax=Natrononativus amylolyticus TaxID=2963434 RepID=UPI0020CCF48E|nr:hypothetical protein [Natrononativus amylolyticus]